MKGLSNLGNTCYLNAALQCLLHAPQLTNYVLSEFVEHDTRKIRLNACALAAEYISLAKAYWTDWDRPGCLDTAGLKAALAKVHKSFGNAQPHDAHEALVVILKHLHDAWAKTPRVSPSVAEAYVDVAAWNAQAAKDGYSMLTELFQGQMELVTAAPCGYRSVSHEHFLGVSLDVCGSVAQGIARVQHVESIDDYAMPSGERTTVRHGRRFAYLPLVLVLHLKRFGPDGDKVDTFVDYSTTLDLTSLGPGGGAYDLFAVMFHRGGHYTAACEAGGRWFLFDDERGTEVHDINAVVQRDAYVLMYKKRN